MSVLKTQNAQRDFTYSPSNAPLNYLYFDADILIVSKPAGLLSVPGKSKPDCLEARVKVDFEDALTVHRLDMATSGLMVFARNKKAQRHLGLQFEKRQLQKTYIAVVTGSVKKDTGIIDLPLICDWPNRPRQMVCFERGKVAQTHWSVLEREAHASRMELTPKTGRSHQLRVHMLSLGHAIIGDRLYANDEDFLRADRLLLHAQGLRLRHPTGGAWHDFMDPCPF